MIAGVVVIGENALDVADITAVPQGAGKAVDGIAEKVLPHPRVHMILLCLLNHIPRLKDSSAPGGFD